MDNTIRVVASAWAGLERLLRPGHPVRATMLATLGRLLALDEPAPVLESQNPAKAISPSSAKFPPSGAARLNLAKQTLQRAVEELRVGFGAESGGGEIGRSTREILIRIEEELAVWSKGIKDALSDAMEARKGK